MFRGNLCERHFTPCCVRIPREIFQLLQSLSLSLSLSLHSRIRASTIRNAFLRRIARSNPLIREHLVRTAITVVLRAATAAYVLPDIS